VWSARFKRDKRDHLDNLAEAIAAAAYVEQLLAAEQQWITNRLSWLFISQSFCLTAFVILATSTGTRFPGAPAAWPARNAPEAVARKTA